MKMLNPKGGFPKCSFCDAKSRWVASGMGCRPTACDEHKESIRKWEQDRRELDARGLTEADYATWAR